MCLVPIVHNCFSHASLKPFKLKAHLKIVHPDHADDDLATFESKRARFNAAGTLPKLGYESLRKPAIKPHIVSPYASPN